MKQPVLAAVAVLVVGAPAAADCLADFQAINAVRAEAGPFRVEMRVSFVPPALADKQPDPVPVTTITTPVVPPGSYRMTKTGEGSPVDVIVLDGRQAWRRQGERWEPLGGDTLPGLTGSWPLAEYVASANLAKLQCLGEQFHGDRPALAFGFDTAAGTTMTHVTAYFDPATRLPAGSRIVTEAGARAIVETSYVFDTTIDIAAPVK